MAVVITAAIATSTKLRWIPGRASRKSLTPTWMPLPSLTLSANPEASQPIVYAPIAKNAT